MRNRPLWRKLFGLFCLVVGATGAISTAVSAGRDFSAGRAVSEIIARDEFAVGKAAEKLRASVSNQNKPAEKLEWQSPDSLLASTPERRLRAAKRLKIDKGERVAILLSVDCGDCEREALKLNEMPNRERFVGIAAAPSKAAAEWKKKFDVKYRIVSVGDALFNDLGVVILPTLLLMRDGEVVGASNLAEVVE